MINKIYSHSYFARCDLMHSRKVSALSECNKPRTRHYEHCKICGSIVPMNVTAYIKPVSVFTNLVGDYSGNRRQESAKPILA